MKQVLIRIIPINNQRSKTYALYHGCIDDVQYRDLMALRDKLSYLEDEYIVSDDWHGEFGSQMDLERRILKSIDCYQIYKKEPSQDCRWCFEGDITTVAHVYRDGIQFVGMSRALPSDILLRSRFVSFNQLSESDIIQDV